MLARDIEHLRQSFASDKGESGAGKLILRNEHASKVYTTEVLLCPHAVTSLVLTATRS